MAKSRLTFQKRQKELARIRKREDKKKRLAEQRDEQAEVGQKGPQIATTDDLVGLGLAEPEEAESDAAAPVEGGEESEESKPEEETARE